MLGSALFLVTGDDGRWHPGIGDPTFVGWFTVFAYAYAAYWAYRVRARCLEAMRPYRGAATPESIALRQLSRFWLFTFALLVALGINKQLDLQTWLTEIGRDLAHEQGWYEQRRAVQRLFIALLALGGLATAGILAHHFRRVLRLVWVALSGIVLLFSFVVIRAASFHHVDQFLGAGPFKMNWVLELGSIGIIAFAARRDAKLGSNGAGEPRRRRR